MNLVEEIVEISDRLANLSLVKKRSSSSSLRQPNPKKLKQPQYPKFPLPRKNNSSKMIKNQIINLIQQWNQILQKEEQQISKERTESESVIKKLTRVITQMRKLITQWEKLLQEEEEQKNESLRNLGKEKGESVSVEKSEDGSFLIHFNCPCKCSFQFLFSGRDYYYKLCEKK